ncbi:MAG: hypothetical protein SGILL_004195, partial [Bacillariaceae sp.]
WLEYNNVNTSNEEQRFKKEQQMSSLLQSLIHVWATFDPKLAESYLKELAEGVLSGKAYEPPTTIDWNRVISAYSIVYDQPAEGHRVLEDFWAFYDKVNAASGSSEDGDSSHFVNAWKVGAPNLRSYNSVLEGYARQLNSEEANKIFSRLHMVTSTSPSIATYTSVIKANAKDLKMVNALAKQCIDEWRKSKSASIDAHDQRRDPQAAIEWLLAYSRLESMNENEIVAWTTRLMQWYRQQDVSEVDLTVFLQILFENGFLSSDESIEKLLSVASADEALSILELLPSHPSLKMRATVMRTLSQDPSRSDDVEKMFLKWRSAVLQGIEGKVDNSNDLADMCTSLIVAWSKRTNMKKVKHWLQVIDKSPDLPPVNLTAQMAVVEALCQTKNSEGAEQFVLDIEAGHGKDSAGARPDTTMKNVVLKAWANAGNGERAAAFFKNHIEHPDIVSWNSVINAFCKAGEIDKAESWANSLVDKFHEESVGTPRPDSVTFTVILAAWRQSNDRNAAARAEHLLMKMQDLYERGTLLYRPNAKSYNVVLDAWEKSRLPEAGSRAQELLSSSPFQNDDKLVRKVKRIQGKCRSRDNAKSAAA